MEHLKQKWEDTQKIWIMFQYHETINGMEDVFLECCNHYQNKNHEEFHLSFEKLKRAIEDLKHREEISWENIM